MAKEVICEADCPNCGTVLKLTKMGYTICPHCKELAAELTVNWVAIKDMVNE